MVGLVELFGANATGWQRPELALTVRSQRDTSAIRIHLLEIGLIAARERGARDVFVAFNSFETYMRAIVRQYGARFDQGTDTAGVPCDFVPVDGVSSWCAD
jgi:hypothetical protein